MLIVQKFGGSSLANKNRVFNVAKKVVGQYKKGNDIVVVLSAQGDTTDNLIEKAKELSVNPSKRELDMLLATGEQQSVALMAIAIESLGCKVISLNGEQAGIKTTKEYNNSKIEEVQKNRIEEELGKGNIVIVTGFQGINSIGDITTLGRGGSDTTAVAIAGSLKADVCEIYTDVAGIYTADPRIVKNAKKINSIGYDDMLEFALSGATVLHNRAVEVARKNEIKLIVRSSFKNEEGTMIGDEKGREKNEVKYIATDKNVAKVTIVGLENKKKSIQVFYDELFENDINIENIKKSEERRGLVELSFIICTSALEDVVNILERKKDEIKYNKLNVEKNIAKLSVMGNKIIGNPKTDKKIYKVLDEIGGEGYVINRSKMKLSLIINENNVDAIANIVHDIFF